MYIDEGLDHRPPRIMRSYLELKRLDNPDDRDYILDIQLPEVRSVQSLFADVLHGTDTFRADFN